MKIIRDISILLIIILVSSCSITKKTEKSIIGKWRIILIEDDTDNKKSEEYKKILKELLKSSYFEFKADKTYEISITEKKLKGNWSISDDGSKILTTKDNVYFKIIKQSENQLILKSIKASKSVKMTLKKL